MGLDTPRRGDTGIDAHNDVTDQITTRLSAVNLERALEQAGMRCRRVQDSDVIRVWLPAGSGDVVTVVPARSNLSKTVEAVRSLLLNYQRGA